MREAVLQIAIERVQLWRRITCQRTVHHDAEAAVRIEAEVLMFELAEAAREQACACKQHDGQRGLHDDENLLRQRGAVMCAAVGSAQGFGWIGVRGEPCRSCSEEDSGDERQSKGKSKHGQRWRCIDGDEVRTVEGKRDNDSYT